MEVGWNEIIELLTLIAVVVAFYWSNQSFPPKQTAELIERLSKASDKTETPIDDLLVDVAKLLNELRQNPVIVAPEGSDIEVKTEV